MEMHILTFALSDELYQILEETFSPAEIEVFINQAVRNHIEESLGKKITCTGDTLSEDDINSHEWPQ